MTENQVVNPLLAALKIPGRVFPLPSAGLFYKSGELAPDVVNGEVQVFPMSGLAEMKFRSPDLLYSGKAVVEVIRECVPGILKPEKLTSRDVDAILSFIRIVTYGPTMDIKTSHDCKDAKEHSYVIDIEKIINESTQLSKQNYDLFFNIKLSNGQSVQLTPLSWEDAVTIMQISSMTNVSTEDIDKLYETNISGMIQSMDGVVDKKLISEWVKVAPSPLSKSIQKSVNDGLEGWGPNFEINVTCKDCNTNFKVPLDLNPASFFTL